MNILGDVILAAFCCAMPWAVHRGHSDIGEVLRCTAIDYGMIAAGAIAGASCVAHDDLGAGVLCASAAICSVTDIRTGVVLDTVLVAALIAIFIVAFASDRLPASLLGCVTALFAMGLIFAIARGAMGLGDVKFAGVIGAALGIERGLIALAIAFAIGGLVAAALLASGRVRRGQALPFAPYLAIGAATVACNAWSIAIWG